jgi:hypothetical protein
MVNGDNYSPEMSITSVNIVVFEILFGEHLNVVMPDVERRRNKPRAYGMTD